MAKKKKERVTPEHLTISAEYQHNGRWLRPGTEITVHGIKGRCRFIQHVANSNTETEWVECYSKENHFRAFYLDRIKTIHHTIRTRENSNG